MPRSATQEQTGNATVMCNIMTPPRLRIDDETSARNRRCTELGTTPTMRGSPHTELGGRSGVVLRVREFSLPETGHDDIGDRRWNDRGRAQGGDASSGRGAVGWW